MSCLCLCPPSLQSSGVTWPAGTAYVRVTVGRGGVRPGAPNYGAGSGGNASSLAALDANFNVIALLAMAGGGGGGASFSTG